jgi:DegV family protein with EDD domain
VSLIGKVAISADSVSLTQEKAREYGFTLIPCPIIMDGKQYLDTEIDIDKLYTRLDTKEHLPKTSTANVEEFLRFFTELSQGAEAVLHICMSSVFSPQYHNALKAKEVAGEKLPGARIEVVDSRAIGMGVHFLAIVAVKAVAQGKNIDEVLGLVHRLIPRVTVLAARDTLFYYDKGGRIFEARTWAEAESASSFRSIVEVDASTGGTVKSIARAKTVAQIMDRLVEITKERSDSNKLHGAIGYTRGAADRAEKLRDMLLSELEFDWLYVVEEGASVAVHNGKGLIDYTFSVGLD